MKTFIRVTDKGEFDAETATYPEIAREFEVADFMAIYPSLADGLIRAMAARIAEPLSGAAVAPYHFDDEYTVEVTVAA